MSDALLLTGATGFIGMELLAQLLEEDDGPEILALVRAADDEGARRRLDGVLSRLYDERPPAASRVRAVPGDLLAPGLGLAREQRRALVGSVRRIVHCAASISFELPLEQARAVNVGGVERVVELAREIAAQGRLRRFVHVSTAYVAGRHAGPFGEQDLLVGQRFRNSYERTKSEAEALLAGAAGLPLAIARPSIVVGHRVSGWTPAFNVIYWPMRAAERGLLTAVPARAGSIVDFVPVDHVGRALRALLRDEGARGAYNIVAGELALSAGELVELHAALTGRAPVRFAADGALPAGAEAFSPYFDVSCTFGDERATELLARHGIGRPDPREFLAALISYARASAWGKRAITRQASLAAPQKTGVSA